MAATATLGPLRTTIVVAASMHNGIGVSGTLPWRLPKDMAYFRAATSHVVDTPHDDAAMAAAGYARRADVRVKNAVIMGRHTWDSIPPRFRPLTDRINVVVSTTMSDADLDLGAPDPDTVVVPSFEDAVALLQQRRLARYVEGSGGAALGHAFVIGGAALYRYVLTHTSADWTLDSLLVTRIFAPVEPYDACDVFLAEFRTPKQRAWEAQVAEECLRALPTDERVCADEVDEAAVWRQAPAHEHRAFFAQAAHAARVCQLLDDKSNAIQFQLWRRRHAA